MSGLPSPLRSAAVMTAPPALLTTTGAANVPLPLLNRSATLADWLATAIYVGFAVAIEVGSGDDSPARVVDYNGSRECTVATVEQECDVSGLASYGDLCRVCRRH